MIREPLTAYIALMQNNDSSRSQPPTSGESNSSADLLFVVPTHEQIAKRAYELWLSRGCPDNFELENWCDAERALRYELNLPKSC